MLFKSLRRVNVFGVLGTRYLFIQSLPTPNPLCLKFVPGKTVLGSHTTKEYNHIKQASDSFLVRKLFFIEGVNKVLLGPDFITVTKTEETDWNILKPEVLATLTQFFTNENTLILNKSPQDRVKKDETSDMIEELINIRVAPLLHEDGGDIEFRDYDATTGVFVKEYCRLYMLH